MYLKESISDILKEGELVLLIDYVVDSYNIGVVLSNKVVTAELHELLLTEEQNEPMNVSYMLVGCFVNSMFRQYYHRLSHISKL